MEKMLRMRYNQFFFFLKRWDLIMLLKMTMNFCSKAILSRWHLLASTTHAQPNFTITNIPKKTFKNTVTKTSISKNSWSFTL